MSEQYGSPEERNRKTHRTQDAQDRREEWKRQTIHHETPRKTATPHLTHKQQKTLDKNRREAEQPRLFQ